MSFSLLTNDETLLPKWKIFHKLGFQEPACFSMLLDQCRIWQLNPRKFILHNQKKHVKQFFNDGWWMMANEIREQVLTLNSPPLTRFKPWTIEESNDIADCLAFHASSNLPQFLHVFDTFGSNVNISTTFYRL